MSSLKFSSTFYPNLIGLGWRDFKGNYFMISCLDYTIFDVSQENGRVKVLVLNKSLDLNILAVASQARHQYDNFIFLVSTLNEIFFWQNLLLKSYNDSPSEATYWLCGLKIFVRCTTRHLK